MLAKFSRSINRTLQTGVRQRKNLTRTPSTGRVKRFKRVAFHEKMRPEGITHGAIGGRGAIVFVDDRGGYQFIWDDDGRLQQ